MKKILLVTAITIFFILYLFQHRYSMKCTQDIAQLEKTRQLLKEEITGLEGKKTMFFMFVNIEDLAQKLNLTFPKINYHNNTTRHAATFFKDTISVAQKNNHDRSQITTFSHE